MSIRALVILGACVLLAPSWADAQWFASPFAGVALGGGVSEAPKLDYGASVGWIGRTVGFEVDASHRPDFFGVTDVPDVLFSQSSVTTLMFNGLVSVPLGGERFRPYAAGGAGLLRSNIGGQDDFVRGRSNNVGFNVGGGVMTELSDRIGIRGDVRYFRDLQDFDEGDSEFFGPRTEKLDFWRVVGGIVFRF